MTEDKNESAANESAANEPLPAAKKAKSVAPKKAPANSFNKKNSHFVSPKSGNPGNKGGAFKGGGMKKGK